VLLTLLIHDRSALLNPYNEIFCLGGKINQVTIPIQINQTQPVLIELLRRDFDGEHEETITIKSSEAKRLTKAAYDHHKRTRGTPHPDDPLVLRYPVKKPGQYTLNKVLDESKLQVRPRASEVIVVTCPSARIITDKSNRCRGDLSDISFEVHGTPPLKLKYRKLVNGNPAEASFQSIQPPDFISPSSRQKQLVSTKPSSLDVSWAELQKVSVPINESLMALGKYSYFIDEVEDALGNRIVYFNRQDDDEAVNSKNSDVSQLVTVHDRPAISIPANAGCNAERPLKVAAGQEENLPHQITSAGHSEYGSNYRGDYAFDEDHIIEYEFFPESSLRQGGGESIATTSGKLTTFKKTRPSDSIKIKEPGLYVIKNIHTKFCQGEVTEPSSCLLQNPLKPSVKVSSTEITHKCANSPIGLQVTFDFEGTPPFKVRWMQEDYSTGQNELRSQTFNTYRGQIDIRQNTAGRYKYTFRSVSDHYYENEYVGTVLEQDVKPSASAFLDHSQISKETKNVCLGEPAIYPIILTGDAPWTVEYEIIHGKSRKKFSLKDLTDPKVNIEATDLKEGGEYTLALTSITDVSGCKEFLKDQLKFNVWSQKPTAAFGKINGKYSTSILEGNTLRLPLRFTGQAPFAYVVDDEIDGVNKTESGVSRSAVHSYDVRQPGTYTLKATRDDHCFGDIEESGSQFVVDWIPRPALALAQSSSVEQKGSIFIKQDVCEGEDDNVDVNLQGKISALPTLYKFSLT
jgi:nucleoporin POM152